MRGLLFALFLSTSLLSQKSVYISEITESNYYVETKNWFDGTVMNDTKTDGVIYKKNGKSFFVLSEYLEGREVNAKKFGVKADGKTDDSESMQRAFYLAVKYGLTLRLPYGEILTTRDLLLDVTSSKGKTTVVGSGISNTVIKNRGDRTKYALRVKGDYFNGLHLTGFRIERDLSTPEPTGNIGLSIEKQVYASLENIEVLRFKTGIEITDVSTLYLKGVNARYCGQGFYFSRGQDGSSNPNLIEMHSCALTSNSKWGIQIINGHSVNIYSSLFEDNTLGGINFSYDGTNGANSLNLHGSYFEGNSGTDFLFTGNGEGSHNLIGNTFNRVTKTKFTNTNVLFDFTSAPNKNVVNMIGNGFLSANNYQRATNRSPVKILSSPSSVIEIFDTNFYQEDTDRPAYKKEYTLLHKE